MVEKRCNNIERYRKGKKGEKGEPHLFRLLPNNLLSLFQQIHLVVFPHRCTFDGNIIAFYGITEPIISDLSNILDAAYDVLSPESEAPQAQPDI